MSDESNSFWNLAYGFLAGVAVATVFWGLILIDISRDSDEIDRAGAVAVSVDAPEADRYIGDARVVDIEVRDWEWVPSTIKLRTGEPVVLEITNTGRFPHGIWVPDLGINVDTPTGEVTRVPLTPTAAGEYLLACSNRMCGTTAQHEGMAGTIVVEGSAIPSDVAAAPTTTATTTLPSTTTTTAPATTTTSVTATTEAAPSHDDPTPTAAAAVVAVVDVIDTFGFHEMTEEIEGAGSMAAIDPGYLGVVAKAVTVAETVGWPEEVAGAAAAFLGDARALAAGLGSGDLAGAKAAAAGLHQTQHELSETAYGWLGG